uniref:Zinc metalloproteinase nas-14-like n=1 Tax=Crassostrea virginica TaxID=6565 RepID=A0A8B8DJK5_CRAVI|nr:zinc metalloproteinase nas-14-like [Crassostrea virginica]XP_022327172.1 zinc metalloproteinase nas-14-like [Crassostrea virginica]
MTKWPLLFISVFICVRQSMESMPSCQDIFAMGDSLMCTTCGAEINTRCRINLLDENPAVVAPYLEILRTTSLLACFYSDASYLNPESHVIAICKPGSMCGSVRSGDSYIRGCVSHNSAHTQKCSEDFCNHSFDSTDLDMVNIILLKYVTSPKSTSTTTTTTTTATTTRTTTQPSTTTTTTPPITTSATTETRPASRTTIPSTTPTTRSSLTSAIIPTIVIKTTTENHHTNVTARACEGNPSILCHSENPFCPFFDGVTGICSTLITESSLNFFGRCALYCNKCQDYCDVMAAKLTTTTTTTTTITTTPQRTTMLSATSSDGVQFKTCRENPKFVCYNRPEFCSIVNNMTGMCTRNPLVDSIEFFHRCSLYCNRCEEYCDIVATFLTTLVSHQSTEQTLQPLNTR